MDTQAKATDLAITVLAAKSPPQISAACGSIESFLHKHTPDQSRWFFSITFPTLICKIFGFDESSATQKSHLSNGWIDVVTAANDSDLAGRVFNLLSPTGVLMSSISAVDRLSLVKYVFPIERLPEWVRFMLQNERDCRVLTDLCPLFKGRVKEDILKGSSFQVQLNAFEYYMFWFAYYPVCREHNESYDTVRVHRSRRSRLEKWAYSIPGFSNASRGAEQKMDCNLYSRFLYAYLRAFVPVYDLNIHQPYRSSLLHYSSAYDSSVLEQAEFFGNTLIHFWLVDNDFSPLPVNLCKSFGVMFPFRTVLGETPPTSGLADVVNVFVKYLNFSLVVRTEGSDQVEPTGSPRWRFSASADIKSGDAALGVFGFRSVSSWNSWIQRPLYRFILRTFLFCPVETSTKNISQVFTLWINYMEPWMISLEDFAGLDANNGVSTKNSTKEITQSPSHGYSSSWKGFVLTNYLFYSSLVMHFIGFAHKFLHTDAEVIVQMVLKVMNVLTSSEVLTDLIKEVDTVFHSKPSGSSNSMLNNLYRFVPTIQEQLQDWEEGLCESDADGSFLHENWNKDLRLFSDGEDGGQQLLQLFVLRAESELQAISGDNLAKNFQCLDSLKTQLGCLFGRPPMPLFMSETRQCQKSRDEIFKPRIVGNRTIGDVKYKGDWIKRPISNDEVAWLAKLLVNLSGWLNKSLGLNEGESSSQGGDPACSYVELSSDVGNVCGLTETMKVVMCSVCTWLITLSGAVLNFMRKHGLRVNLRILASKKIVMVLFIIVVFCVSKKAFAGTQTM